MKPQENQTQQSFEQQNLFGKGSENKAYAAFFTGNSYLNPLTRPASVGRHLTLLPGADQKSVPAICP